MSWLDKVKSGGSSSIEGPITDYAFTDHFPFGDNSDPDGNIYLCVDVTEDGADEATQKALYLGSAQYLVIDEDGKVLKHVDGEESVPRLYDKGDAFRLLVSMEEAGFPMTDLPDPEETKTIDLRGILGWRVRLVNEIDEEATKKFGKRKGKGKNKDKEYNRTWLKCTKVTPPDEAPASSKKSPSKSAAKGATPAAKKPAPKPEPEADTDTVDTFLTELLADQKNNSIAKDGLTLAVARKGAKDKLPNAEREAIRKMLNDDEYLSGAAERGLIIYDASAKKPVIALA